MNNSAGIPSVTLSNKDFQTNNLKASIFPNPTQNNFNIEMENDLKSVEIYSLLGTKVLTAKNKNVNVSNLSKGTYMVRVQDKNGNIATQKLVKE